jgi:DNA-binding NarL/FixJ family response regulator
MSKTRILLADDHAIVRAGIRKMIEQLPDLEVIGEIGDGSHLLEIIEKQMVDCLIMDVTMPDFQPIQAIREIRASHPDLKILVVSAYDDDIYVKGLLNAGVDGYHMKDQSLNDLKLAIQKILAGERWISSSLISKLTEPSENLTDTPNLTDRQRSILNFLHQGLDNKSIAREMGLSVKTVENHLTRLYQQLDVQSRLEAVNYVVRHPQILAIPGEEAASFTIPVKAQSNHSGAILVVDDNARYRKQLLKMIGKANPDAMIYEAADIQTTLQLAAQIKFQLVLIDVILGDEDGIQCSRKLKNASPQSRIVLISAYPDREFHRQGLQSGAVAFLDKKNLDLAAIKQVVNDVIA